MATDTIQVKLPITMKPMFDDLKRVRATTFDRNTYTAIVIDALKFYHGRKVK